MNDTLEIKITIIHRETDISVAWRQAIINFVRSFVRSFVMPMNKRNAAREDGGISARIHADEAGRDVRASAGRRANTRGNTNECSLNETNN